MEVATPKSGGTFAKLATPAKVIKKFLRSESVSTLAILNEVLVYSTVLNEAETVLKDGPKPVWEVATYISCKDMEPRQDFLGYTSPDSSSSAPSSPFKRVRDRVKAQHELQSTDNPDSLDSPPSSPRSTKIRNGVKAQHKLQSTDNPDSLGSQPSSPRSIKIRNGVQAQHKLQSMDDERLPRSIEIKNEVQTQHKLQSTDSDRDTLTDLLMDKDLGRVPILENFRDLGQRFSPTEYVAEQYYDASIRTQDKVVVGKSAAECHGSSSSDDDSPPFALQSAVSGQNNDLKQR